MHLYNLLCDMVIFTQGCSEYKDSPDFTLSPDFLSKPIHLLHLVLSFLISKKEERKIKSAIHSVIGSE